MAEIIQDPVTNVIDGDTFDMNVTKIGCDNQYTYNSSERIRIANINAAELGSFGGYRDKQKLINTLSGKIVRCLVQSRDVFHRIVADVQIIKHYIGGKE